MSRRQHRQRQRGFVLIYVVLVLVFLTGLVIHATRQARSAGQISARLQEQLAARTRLQEAAQLLRARLQYRWAAAATERQFDKVFGLQAEQIEIDEVALTVAVADANARPDVNQLTEAEWHRLLRAYRLDDAEALRLAREVIAHRQQLGKFSRLEDLTDGVALPESLLMGFSERGANYPPLVDLLATSGAKRLSLAVSPWPLFAALLEAKPDQLQRWEAARKQKPPTLAEAEAVFGGAVRAIGYDSKPEKLRYQVTVPGVPVRVEFEIWVDQGQLRSTTPRTVMLPA